MRTSPPAAASGAPLPLPGEHLDPGRAPAHWVLARIGKQVLRPGGRRLTLGLLEHLGITEDDRVVEFAPGVGASTRLILERRPAAYTGVERDPHAAALVRELLAGTGHTCRTADAQATGLGDGRASVVLGEAYLSMLPDPAKARVLAEAFRLLEPGGRFGVHELALVSAARPPAEQEAVRRELSAALHVGARPLTVEDWRRLLETAGFVVSHQALVPMELLRPRQVLRDEGARGTLLIMGRVLREPAIRARVCVLRRTFRSLHGRIAAVGLVAHKPRSTP